MLAHYGTHLLNGDSSFYTSDCISITGRRFRRETRDHPGLHFQGGLFRLHSEQEVSIALEREAGRRD